MLPSYLIAFNEALLLFQKKFPRVLWTQEFMSSLLNDYAFYSSRIEDDKLQYGDTIRFLNNETVRGVNLASLIGVSEHQFILTNVLDNIQDFELSELNIKNIHYRLMKNPLVWESTFQPHLVGAYRNIPTVGARIPFFENKQYAPHYNLEFIMATYMELFNNRFSDVDNEVPEKHLLSHIAYFHNRFLNDIHPFADGNGRVCRIVIGAILIKNGCPPIFPEINSDEQQMEYISTIVACEKSKKDDLLVAFFAEGMTKHLLKRCS